jgi:acyl dehydratase
MSPQNYKELPVKAKSGFIVREVGEGTVLVPVGERVVDMNGMVVLNETGRFIWERLDGTCSPDDIAQGLTETFEVTLEQARNDVEEFLAQLERMGMVEKADAAE